MRLKFKAEQQDKLFFTSDEHYLHQRVLEFGPTPRNVYFKDLDDMQATFIERHNNTVPEDGITFHLGDVSLGNASKTLAILEQLNGTHHLIIGNHESTVLDSAALRKFFVSIEHYATLFVDDADGMFLGRQQICLSHYPMEMWDGSQHGTWMVHGHCHNTLPLCNTYKRLDVGVDTSIANFAPVSYKRVKEYMMTCDHTLPKKQ